MRALLLRTLVFALAVTAASLAVDLVVTLVYQGGPPAGAARRFLVFRSALHGATLVLTAAGALVGFAALRSYAPDLRRVATLGAALGVFTLPALLAAYRAGGFRAMAAWLLLASLLVSGAGARLLGRRSEAKP